MAATYQIFVRLLDGKTKCLQVPCPTISGETLKQNVFRRTGIPLRFQRLTTGSREIANETLIHASEDGIFPSCNLLLRLRGGKGGFGSLLRGAATKAGQKKTNNFDACRDMSGRRLRHVNAEKKLEEWKADAEGRKLEKIAEQFLKKKAKEVKKSSSPSMDKYIAKYKEDSEKRIEEVKESVRQSFDLYVKLKRKILPLSGPTSKRLKIWSGKKKVDESDTEDSEEDSDDDVSHEKFVVLDSGNHKEGDGNSGSVSGCQSNGESLGGGSVQSNIEEENTLCTIGCLEYEDASGGEVGCEVPSADSDGYSKPQNALFVETIADDVIFSCSENLLGYNAVNLTMEGCVEPKDKVKKTMEGSIEPKDKVKKTMEGSIEPKDTKMTIEGSIESEDKVKMTMEEPVEPKDKVKMTIEELNFDKFNSATEMEVVGMERLKIELQSRGLKCGGTLHERAARLFLLKSTPLEKLSKKFFSAPTKKPASIGGGGK